MKSWAEGLVEHRRLWLEHIRTIERDDAQKAQTKKLEEEVAALKQMKDNVTADKEKAATADGAPSNPTSAGKDLLAHVSSQAGVLGWNDAQWDSAAASYVWPTNLKKELSEKDVWLALTVDLKLRPTCLEDFHFRWLRAPPAKDHADERWIKQVKKLKLLFFSLSQGIYGSILRFMWIRLQNSLIRKYRSGYSWNLYWLQKLYK